MSNPAPLESLDWGDGPDATREIRRAYLAARRAGPIEEPLIVLSPEELDAPIAGDDDECDLSAVGHDGDGGYDDDDGDAAVPAEPVDPRVVIDGYAIEREISRGGQATVYEATQESTGRRVAVKVLPGGPFANRRTRARFEREARILASVDHPNIVGIVDRGRTADGSFFLVMPYVDGVPLDEYALAWRRTRPDDPRPVLRMFAEIARAVDEAHRRGIVHRDLKPSNVRVDRRGRPYVLDFGLARVTMPSVPQNGGGGGARQQQTVTLAGQILGTLPWASPEQAAGGSLRTDARSDVYALGVSLYYALTGRFPYPVAGDIREVLNNIRSALPGRPSQALRVRCPWPEPYKGSIDAIVLKALAKSPEQRYASAGQLASDLEECAAGRPAGPPPAPRRRRRRLVASGLVGLVSILLGAFAAGPLRQHLNPVAARPPMTAGLPASTNSVGMSFVRIPATRFLMGSPRTEEGRQGSEPLHEVDVGQPYHLSTMEVTRAQYRLVMGVGAAAAAATSAGDDHRPVTGVSWHDASEFCRRLSAREGEVYRLPTEAEWELACRAGSATRFGGADDPGRVAWHRGNSGGSVRSVATKPPNVWGLYDMQGNVREWCADVYDAGYSPTPDDVRRGIHRVVKGGGFDRPEDECRPASRTGVSPDDGYPNTGFRVVREAGRTF